MRFAIALVVLTNLRVCICITVFELGRSHVGLYQVSSFLTSVSGWRKVITK